MVALDRFHAVVASSRAGSRDGLVPTGDGGGVTEVSGDGELFSGLPEEVRRLLGTPPATEKMLLELSMAWAGLPSGQARMAEWLRLFVITWDPLEWLTDRPDGFATVNVDPDAV